MNEDYFKDLMLNKLTGVEVGLAEIQKDVRDICVRLSVLENSYKTHVDHQLESTDRKFKLTSAVFGVISAGSALFHFFRN